MSVFYFVAFTVLISLLLRMTVTGRHITLMGANAESAKTAGISPRAVCTAVFAIFGVGCAIAGLILASQIGQVAANDFPTLTIDVLAAVLVVARPSPVVTDRQLAQRWEQSSWPFSRTCCCSMTVEPALAS